MNIYGDHNTKIFFAEQLINDVTEVIEEEAPDFEITAKLKVEDIEDELPSIVHKEFDYYDYSEKDGSNNRFMRKQQNTDKTKNLFEKPSDKVKKAIEGEPTLFTKEELPF